MAKIIDLNEGRGIDERELKWENLERRNNLRLYMIKKNIESPEDYPIAWETMKKLQEELNDKQAGRI